MNLRPYQKGALNAIQSGWSNHRTQLAVIPTGGGKTVLFAHLAAAEPGRTLVLAHRDELLTQAQEKIKSATGIVSEREQADEWASPTARVVVGSVQTLRGKRLQRFASNHFDLIVCDEAHHVLATGWQNVLNHFHEARILGVTATPDRGDKKNLGRFFESVAYEINLLDLIQQGYLSPIKVKALPINIDLTKVEQKAGDYKDSDLDAALLPYLEHIAKSIVEECAFRKTLLFLPLVATAQAMADILRKHGIQADYVHGMDPRRREKLEEFKGGHTEALCNAMLLTEGYDNPSIDCVVNLRPTRSRPLYCQIVGRGTRTAPGKKDLLLLDFLWMHQQHRLIRPAHIFSETEDDAENATKATVEAAKSGRQEEFDVAELAGVAKSEREAKLAKELADKARRKARILEADDFAREIGDFRNASAESGPINSGHQAVLIQAGIDPSTVHNQEQAERLVKQLAFRSQNGLTTPKQIRLLRQLGIKNPSRLTAAQASTIIGQRIGKRDAA